MKQVITNAKRQKMAKAYSETGSIPKIKYIALGTGGVDDGGEVISPNQQLNSEILRREYTAARKVSDFCYEYSLKLEANELVGEKISEIALIDEEGDVLAIANFSQRTKDETEDTYLIQDNY